MEAEQSRPHAPREESGASSRHAMPIARGRPVESTRDTALHHAERDGYLGAHVVAVCISNGGVPKRPLEAGTVNNAGIEGDGHAHAKHNRPERAVSILDVEIMRDLVEEGFPLQPGTAGENLSVEGLHVQQMQPGVLLEIGDVTLRLEEPRKPCFVLDVIHPTLKEAIVGRCGYMASVIRGGKIRAGMPITFQDRVAPSSVVHDSIPSNA